VKLMDKKFRYLDSEISEFKDMRLENRRLHPVTSRLINLIVQVKG